MRGRERTLRRAGVGLWLFCVVMFVAAVVMLVFAWSGLSPAHRGDAQTLAMGLTYGTVGCLIAQRLPRNPVGWLLLLTAVFASLNNVADFYYLATLEAGQPWPGGVWGLWVEGWTWPPEVILLPTTLPLLFPDGRLPSSRWRPVLWGTVAVLAITMLVSASMRVYEVSGRSYHNPLPLPYYVPPNDAVFAVLLVAMLTVFGLGALSLLVRWRSAASEQRQQIKWFVYTCAILTVGGALSLGVVLVSGGRQHADLLGLVSLNLLPFGIGIAMARHRLYDIDWVISRTLVVAVLALFVTAVYVAAVVVAGRLLGAGSANLGLSVAATAFVAVAFQPLRTRVQRLANRLVYGHRATPYEVMAQFSHRLASAPTVEELLPEAARAAAEAVAAPVAEARMLLPNGQAESALWPVGGELAGEAHVEPVENGGERIGELVVYTREPPGPTAAAVLKALARQAGVAFRNVRLTVELEARLEEIAVRNRDLSRSRQRIVAAADEQRRRLEAEISEGASRRLSSISHRLAETRPLIVANSSEAGRQLDEMAAEAGVALESLRELARGIFPPLLVDRGLLTALTAHVRKLALPVEIEAGGLEDARFSPQIEAALYFCCVAALQTAARLGASRAAIRLDARTREELAFTISAEDLKSAPSAEGSGEVVDRIEAVGGRLRLVPGTRHAHLEGAVPIGDRKPQREGAAVRASSSVSGPNSDLGT
jgi:signal transduction histidine kinase